MTAQRAPLVAPSTRPSVPSPRAPERVPATLAAAAPPRRFDLATLSIDAPRPTPTATTLRLGASETSAAPATAQSPPPKVEDWLANELEAYESAAEALPLGPDKAQARRVFLLLGYAPSRTFPRMQDAAAFLEDCIEHAVDEADTLEELRAQLGDDALEALLFAEPVAFIETITARLASLASGLDAAALARNEALASNALIGLARLLPDDIWARGLPLSRDQANQLRVSRLLDRVLTFAMAHGLPAELLTRYLRALMRWELAHADASEVARWDAGIDRAIAKARKGEPALDADDYVRDQHRLGILRGLHAFALDALTHPTTDPTAALLAHELVRVTQSASGGIRFAWHADSIASFHAVIADVDRRVVAADPHARIWRAAMWASERGYAAEEARDALVALRDSAPEIIGSMLALFALQFVPIVGVAADVILLMEFGLDALKTAFELGRVFKDAALAKNLVEVENASARIAASMVGLGVQLVMFATTLGVMKGGTKAYRWIKGKQFLRANGNTHAAREALSAVRGDIEAAEHIMAYRREQPARIRAQVDAILESAQTIQPYRIKTVAPEEFARRFGSQKGRSLVAVTENGEAVIYARGDATANHIADEATHLVQLADPRSPRIAEHIHELSEVSVKRWHELDVGARKHLFESKLEVEIDAKRRQLEGRRVSDPEWRALHDQLRNLEALRTRSRALTDEQLLAYKASGKLPPFLEDPAWLFAKETQITAGARLTEPALDLATLPTTVVADSPAKAFGQVKRIGEPWTEVTSITSSNSGRVSIDGASVSVGGRRYVFEHGATIHVKPGEVVSPGQLLATEPPVTYRLVNVEPVGRAAEQRLEIHSTKRKGWVQAGEHSTRRGARVETAARNQLHAELAAEKAAAADPRNPASKDPKRLVEFTRVENQTSTGGGFDDVLIEFRGDPPEALIRIIEVKDYPHRNVSLGEMTAIRDNLPENLRRLNAKIDAAGTAHSPAEFHQLSEVQIRALKKAKDTKNYRVELHLGPTTRIGAETGSAARTATKLRIELKNSFGGRDVLAPSPRFVEQKAIDAVPAKSGS